ncbi:MAG: hypothetical protein M1813_009167 [Trichoglossum hirsutum]|nr:MAG: hypothetical protein M1813_009167 [Trichoglossum hirsutum]
MKGDPPEVFIPSVDFGYEGDEDPEAIRAPPAGGGENGEQLRDVLSERHVNVIQSVSVSVASVHHDLVRPKTLTIFKGIFLTCGKILHDGGPGGAILAYVLTGTIVWSVIASLGEMTALMPVKSPITEFTTRYVDSAIGFATGWMYWFAYVCVFAAQITASSSLMAFNYDDKIVWKFGRDISPVLWIFIFLLYMTSTNLLPVKYYGEFEYFCGCIKMITITGLILLMVIITNGSSSLPHGQRIGDKCRIGVGIGPVSSLGQLADPLLDTHMYSVEIKEDSWESGERNPPASFRSFISRSNGQPGIPVTRSAMTTAIFSYIGMDIVAATAAENKFQGNSESIKMATRKISLRIILLYFFAIVTASFPVAYDDPHLLQTNHGLKSGASSPFMIAIFNAGIPVLPHLLNAFFIFSSSSAGINALYVASRTLHALAVSGRVFDGPIARRLKLTVFGVPMVAVFTSSSFGLLAFMSTKAQPSKVLQGLISNSSISIMLVYMVISLAFISFYKKLGRNLGRGMETREYRKGSNYPYKSHFQWLRAVYAFVGCSLFILFNGWDSFLGGRATADKFLPSYISIFVFLALIFCFKLNAIIRQPGSSWGRDATMLYGGAQEVHPHERRGGRRHWATGSTTEKIIAFLRDWII